MSEDIAQIHGTWKTYLRNLQIPEKVFFDIISNYYPSREQETWKLIKLIWKADENSLLEKLDKLKIYDDKIGNEVEHILQRNDSLRHWTVAIDTCLLSPQTEDSFGVHLF